MNAKDEIIALIESPKKIAKEKILHWMADDDLSVRGALYELTDTAWKYIQPALSTQEQCSFMRLYLVECLEKDPDNENNDFIHSGFEVAWEIAAWMKHLRSIKDTATVLSLPIILPIALFSKEPFFATVKDKYGKATKWWAEYGVIFSPF